jgi:hypothetical protein
MRDYNKQSGLIRFIVLFIAAILLLSYFNIDLKSLAEKPQTKNNIGYVLTVGGEIWHEYLSKPAAYFWNNIFLGLLWSAFTENLNQIKNNKPPMNFQPTAGNTAPQYPN